MESRADRVGLVSNGTTPLKISNSSYHEITRENIPYWTICTANIVKFACHISSRSPVWMCHGEWSVKLECSPSEIEAHLP